MSDIAAEENIGKYLAQVEALRAEAVTGIEQAATTDDLEEIRVRYTGRKSALSDVMRAMGRLGPSERPALGSAVNAAKEEIELALGQRGAALREQEMHQQLLAERLDVTLPGTDYPQGYSHPALQSMRELLDLFRQMGYAVYEGPEVEWERFNFDLLNIPKHHPARDIQDTFWIRDDMVMRTQTSPAQIRIMQTHEPPLRVVVPGMVYRNEAEDASHGEQFTQIEGLAVDTDITMADLKGTLTAVAHRFFGPERRIRFRPSYFPFTEPSAEIDIECAICHGAGCRSCGNEGWLELGGSGMVHPDVLRAGGYDPTKLSGFAFGIGPDRFAMMKYGITDIRLFREDDLRFLRQLSREG